MRAHHVKVEHEFDKPPERIFDYLAKHENMAVFGSKVLEVTPSERGPSNGVGSTRKLKVAGTAPFEETITKFDPAREIEYEITKGTLLRDHFGRMTFAPGSNGGTRFTYEIRVASKVPGVAPLVHASLTRAIEQALAQIERDA